MKIGLVIYGSLETMSGGYLYDRKLVAYLRSQGDTVEIYSLPRHNYFTNLIDNHSIKLPDNLDILIEDELVHPSLLAANHRFHSYPIISLVHNLRSSEKRVAWKNRFYQHLEKRYLESVDGFVFNSETTHTVVCLLAPNGKPWITATPGGDRLGKLSSEYVKKRAVESGPLRVVFLANVTALKGLDILLDAIKLQSNEITLDVVGSLDVEPRYARKMQKRASNLGKNNQIRFHNVLDGEKLAERLQRAQVLVIPSYYEGFGIAYLEGMAFGLPAIGTRVGAIPGLIRDGENGFLINLGDSTALASRLHDFASNRELLERLSLNALTDFQAQPTWGNGMETIRNFLLQTIQTITQISM